MRNHIFAPLGMGGAGFGPPGQPGALDQPRGHVAGWFGRLKPVEPNAEADNIPAYGPAGRVHLSPADQMAFLVAHMRQDPKFLSADSWAWLHTPAVGANYVGGWGIDGPALTHAGSNTFWYAVVALNPDRDRAIALFTNVATQKSANAVNAAVAGFMQGD